MTNTATFLTNYSNQDQCKRLILLITYSHNLKMATKLN